MAGSLSNLVDNLTEQIHKINVKIVIAEDVETRLEK